MRKLGIDISSGNDIHLSADEIRRHIYIVGKAGSGKSNFIEHLALSLIEEGYGLAMLDPHGDSVQKIADCMPKHRTQDCIYWEPADRSHIIGYNPLKGIDVETRPLVTEQMFTSFLHVFRDKNKRRTFYDEVEERMLMCGIRLLLDNDNASLIDLQGLLTDNSVRETLLRRSTDQMVTAFWQDEFEHWSTKQRSENTAGLLNKLGVLTANPALREILSHSSIHPQSIMDSGKILLVNLSKGRLGERSSQLLGALLTSGFGQAAFSRGENRRDFVLIADEFQSFTTTSFAQILAEARKWGLCLVAAHQFLSQVPGIPVQDAVIGTANTIVVFRCGAKDAPLLASELDLDQPRRLKNLPNFRALIKTPENFDARLMQTYPPRKRAAVA